MSNHASADSPADQRSRPYANQLYVSLTPRSLAQVEAIWATASVVVAPEAPALVEHQVAIDRAGLRVLQAAGIKARVIDSDLQALVDESYARWLTPSGSGYAGGLPAWFNQAEPLDAIYTFLDQLADEAPERAHVSVVGKAYENDIKVIRISAAATDGERGSVLVTGTHHAREWLSPMVVMGYAWSLVAQYDSDPAVKKAVDNLNIYIVPVQNPDSYVKTFSGDRLRRTNQSPACRGGVDLNRNWPAKDWGKNTGPCGQETYSGARATSEPETQATKALGDSLSKPLLYLDIHSPADIIMLPYAANNVRPAMYEEVKAAAQTYGALGGFDVGPGIVTAQAAGGGALDYFQESWDQKKGIAFVVELPAGRRNQFDIPPDGIPANVEKNIQGFVAVLEKLAEEHPAPEDPSNARDAGVGMPDAATDGSEDASNPAGPDASGNLGADAGMLSADASLAPLDGSSMPPDSTLSDAGGAPVFVGTLDAGAMGAQPLGSASGQVTTGMFPESPSASDDSSGCSVVRVGHERSNLRLLVLAALAVLFGVRAQYRDRRLGAKRS